MGLEVGPAKPANACLRLPETPETPTGAAQFAGRAPTKARPRTQLRERPRGDPSEGPLATFVALCAAMLCKCCALRGLREVELFAHKIETPPATS